MTYILGQVIGLLATLSCLVLPLFRKKWQMLLCNAFGNFLFGANLLLIGQTRSLLIYAVAILQVFVTLWHHRRKTAVSRGENLLFLGLYVFCGALGYARPMDLLPIFGAVFNMLATFQPDEQKTRYLLLANTSVFAVYYFLCRSTSLLASVITIFSTLAGIWKYREKTSCADRSRENRQSHVHEVFVHHFRLP